MGIVYGFPLALAIERVQFVEKETQKHKKTNQPIFYKKFPKKVVGS